jgi:hypothetical protein
MAFPATALCERMARCLQHQALILAPLTEVFLRTGAGKLRCTGGLKVRHLLTIVNIRTPRYRLDLLPVIPAFHHRATRSREFNEGDLVYYGPMPPYYGIGEVKRVVGRYVAVDFRGTGEFGVHEDVMYHSYLIPIPQATMPLL